MQVGDIISWQRTFTEDDVRHFRLVSGARRDRFGEEHFPTHLFIPSSRSGQPFIGVQIAGIPTRRE